MIWRLRFADFAYDLASALCCLIQSALPGDLLGKRGALVGCGGRWAVLWVSDGGAVVMTITSKITLSGYLGGNVV